MYVCDGGGDSTLIIYNIKIYWSMWWKSFLATKFFIKMQVAQSIFCICKAKIFTGMAFYGECSPIFDSKPVKIISSELKIDLEMTKSLSKPKN